MANGVLVEELDLPMRAYNSLKRNNIVKVGQLLQLSDDELLRMRNFGKKSLDEMKERLVMRGFLPPQGESSDLDDLGDEELEDEVDGDAESAIERLLTAPEAVFTPTP